MFSNNNARSCCAQFLWALAYMRPLFLEIPLNTRRYSIEKKSNLRARKSNHRGAWSPISLQQLIQYVTVVSTMTSGKDYGYYPTPSPPFSWSCYASWVGDAFAIAARLSSVPLPQRNAYIPTTIMTVPRTLHMQI